MTTTTSPIGNPAPLGLLAFGMTTAMLMFVEMGWVETDAQVMIFGYALFLGGLCQLLVGIFELFKGASFPFAVFGCYGSFWLAWAIVLLTKNFGEAAYYYPMAQAAVHAQWGVITSCFFVITLRKNICLVVVFALLAITFFLLAVASGTESVSVTTAAGYVGFFTAIAAFYTGIAELINEEWGRHILPGLKPLYTPEREFLTSTNIQKRISYDSRSNTMLLYFRSIHVRSMDDVAVVREAVSAAIQSTEVPNKKVHVIVDYKDAFISDSVASAYWKMVANLQKQYYLSVRRFDGTAFGDNASNIRGDAIPGTGLSNVVASSAFKKRLNHAGVDLEIIPEKFDSLACDCEMAPSNTQ